MQRLIAASLIVLVLLVGGAGFGYWTYRQNREHPVFITLQFKSETSAAKRDEEARRLKERLSEPGFLLKVSKEVGLRSKWNLESDEAGVAAIEDRLFVDVAGTAISIGVHGKKKDRFVSEQIVLRLKGEVENVLGHKPPAK